jgi:hypothetical protein
MAFTRPSYDVDNIQNATVDTNEQLTMTADQFKILLDKVGKDAQDYIKNTLLPQLENKVAAGYLGALNIVDGTTASNIQAELIRLRNDQEGLVIGQIPDESIVKGKLDPEILNDINSKIKLVDRYNTPTLEIIKGTQITGDIIPKTWTVDVESLSFHNGNTKLSASSR